MTTVGGRGVGGWTSPSDIAAKGRRRWPAAAGAIAAGDPFEPITVRLRGPRASEIGDDIAAVRTWISSLAQYDGMRYTLRWAPIGGRAVGRNQLPTHAVIESVTQLVALLNRGADLRRLESAIRLVGADAGPPREWVRAHPLVAIELADELPQLLAAYDWLDAHRGSGRYLREIAAPGVDTKFAARHRAVLAAMLGVSGSAAGFIADLGLAAKPTMVRMRMAPSLRVAAGLTEVGVRAGELAELDIAPAAALIVENEITYVSVPVPTDGIVIFGGGYAVDLLDSAPWLAGAKVAYWGDIDTHGFAILDRLRTHVPHAGSVLMDAETLLRHREQWVSEPTPTRRELPQLTAAERDIYAGLVTDRWGERVRLEQEFINWPWALGRLNDEAGCDPQNW